MAGILGLAAFLRFYRLGAGYSDDEVFSVSVAKHDPRTIVHLLEQTDTHPPLSYLLLHYWMRVFGSSEIATRSLAALFGVGTVLMLYLLGRLLWGRAAGLIAGALLALSSFNIEYARFNRMYSLLTFLAVASFYCFARLQAAPSRRFVLLYVLSTGAMIYTHVWGWFIAVAQNAVVAAGLPTVGRAQRKVLVRRWLALDGCLLVLISPWLATGFRKQLETTLHDRSGPLENLFGYHAPGLGDIARAAYYAANTHLLALLFFAAGAAAIGYELAHAARADDRPASATRRLVRAAVTVLRSAVRDPRLLLIAGWFLVPFAAGIVLSYVVVPVFQPRYLVVLTLPVFLAVAAALARVAEDARNMVAVGLAAMVALAGLSSERYLSTVSDFFRAPVAYVAERGAPGDLVLYDMGAIVFDYYATGAKLEGTWIRDHQSDRAFIKLVAGHRDALDPQIRDPLAVDTTAIDLKALTAASRHRRVWLLLGPQRPGQLLAATAIRTLRASFGAPHLDVRVGSFRIVLFVRSGTSQSDTLDAWEL